MKVRADLEAQKNNITSTSKFISKIIEPRVSEIFQIARFQIDRMIDIDQIAFGVVINFIDNVYQDLKNPLKVATKFFGRR